MSHRMVRTAEPKGERCADERVDDAELLDQGAAVGEQLEAGCCAEGREAEQEAELDRCGHGDADQERPDDASSRRTAASSSPDPSPGASSPPATAQTAGTTFGAAICLVGVAVIMFAPRVS